MYKLKNKKVRTERGITLIVLVITIIVLLILAGVSIAMLSRTKWIVKSSRGSKNSNRKSRGRGKSSGRSVTEVMIIQEK